MSTRLARSGLLARLGSPSCVAPVQAMATMKPLAREDHKVSQIEFWTKNKALARPPESAVQRKWLRDWWLDSDKARMGDKVWCLDLVI